MNIKDDCKWRYCVVGNIVRTRIDANGVLRYGTAAFRGGTRVYLKGKNYVFGSERDEIGALGLTRGRRFDTKWMPLEQIENVRISRVWKPSILSYMWEWDYDYMNEDWWDDSEEARRDAERFVSEWHEYMSE